MWSVSVMILMLLCVVLKGGKEDNASSGESVSHEKAKVCEVLVW